MFSKALQLCMACLWLTQICAVNLLCIYFVVNFLVCYFLSSYLNIFIYFVNSLAIQFTDRFRLAQDLSAWKRAVMS